MKTESGGRGDSEKDEGGIEGKVCILKLIFRNSYYISSHDFITIQSK